MAKDNMKLVKTKNFEIATNQFGDEKSDKLALLLPGRLDTKDYINFTKHGEFLAERGFFAIAIDPPYTWESPGDIKNYCTTAYVQAVNELIEYFGNRPTLLLGHSRGGAVAMISSENPYVKGLVLVNAAYDTPTSPDLAKVINNCLPEFRDLAPGDVRTIKKVTFELPLNYFEDGAKYNPASYLQSYKGAKVIVHAKEDEFCDIEKVKRIFENLDEPKIMIELEGGHDYRLSPVAIELVNQGIKELVGLASL